MPSNFILNIYPVFLMAMPVNMILVMYVILCILSYDFNKLTMLYIHVHISICMTNKSGLTFFLSIKYPSVCLSVVHLLRCHSNSQFKRLNYATLVCMDMLTDYVGLSQNKKL